MRVHQGPPFCGTKHSRTTYYIPSYNVHTNESRYKGACRHHVAETSVLSLRECAQADAEDDRGAIHVGMPSRLACTAHKASEACLDDSSRPYAELVGSETDEELLVTACTHVGLFDVCGMLASNGQAQDGAYVGSAPGLYGGKIVMTTY